MLITAFVLLLLASAGSPPAVFAGEETPHRHRPPTHTAAAPWLGRFAAGDETVALSWQGGLVLELGRIRVPVDGCWHETVATFAVRHRASWLSGRGAVGLEERHDEGHVWRYWLRLDAGGETLVKSVWSETPSEPGEDAPVVRRFHRVATTRSEP